MTVSFVVHAVLSGDTMTASVVKNEASHPDDAYAYYLIRDQKVIWRSGYGSSDTVSCKLDVAGQYVIKAFVQSAAGVKKSAKSNAVEYFANSSSDRGENPLHGLVHPAPRRGMWGRRRAGLRRGPSPTGLRSEVGVVDGVDFDTFMHAGVSRKLPALDFEILKYPHQDFAVVQGRQQDDRSSSLLAELSRETSLEHSERLNDDGSRMSILASRTTTGYVGPAFVFSGMTRTSERFIFGQDDLRQDDLDAAVDQIGDSAMLRLHGWGARVSTDYFGVSKLYYYSQDGVTCVSNRYHLLLLVLRRLGIELEINAAKAVANLSAVNQVFGQNFSREMEVKNCYCLPVGQALEVRSTGLAFVETGISDVLSAPGEVDESTYPSLIEAARDEVVDNLRVALMHPGFDNVRVDVTGGLDARMVFAALSRLREFESKIYIHTADSQGSPGDLEISLALTQACPFRYDVVPRALEEVSLQRSLLALASVDLGTYYGRKPSTNRTEMPRTLRINGFYGEICARPYYARLIFHRAVDHAPIEEFASNYVAGINAAYRPMVSGPGLAQMFGEELARLPGGSVTEKFDLHYLHYRNGLHCSDRWLNQVLAPGWGPLQSKTMFKLKMATFEQFRSIRVQLDVTDALNVELSRLPYAREKDNKDRQALMPVLLLGGAQDGDASLDSDGTKYQEASRERTAVTQRIESHDTHSVHASNSEFQVGYRSFALAALHRALTEEDLFTRQQGEELYAAVSHFFDEDMRSLRTRSVVYLNKLLSLYYQLDLVNG